MSGLEEAARIVIAGGLIAFPTETFYGLACRADDPAALERLAALKERPADSPFPLIVAEASQVRALTVRDARLDAATDALAAEFWPGPLTLVLPAAPGLHEALVGPDGGVAMRRSSHPVAAALAARVGVPITATSANRRGAPPPDHHDTIAASGLGADLDFTLRDGQTPGHRASTILRLEPRRALLLRSGAVALEPLRRALDALALPLETP
jgi:L-threonylcarbamoyladenylate synthase